MKNIYIIIGLLLVITGTAMITWSTMLHLVPPDKQQEAPLKIPQVPYDWMPIGKAGEIDLYMIEVDNIEYTIATRGESVVVLNKKQLP